MTQRDRVAAMLRRGPHTTADFLAAFIPRFSARIEELRSAGWVIERERVTGSSFQYRLVSEPRRPTSPAAEPVEVAIPEAFDNGRLFDLPTLGAYSEAA